MDTLSTPRDWRPPCRARSLALLLAFMAAAGCKSPPQNPFLAADKQARAGADNPETKTARELADEVAGAFKASLSDARGAAEQTAADAADRARLVASRAKDSAGTLASSAQTSAQVGAVEKLADWPIEQAGPLLIVAIAEGPPAVRRAAAAQLAERWPAAADFPVEAATADRAAALAGLRKLWVRQYGEINQTVATAQAHAQQILSDAERVANDARQVAYEAADAVGQVQQTVSALRQSDLPAAARREAAATLERLAQDAQWQVRRSAAQAMGEAADPAFLPVLMEMLSDEVEVQRQALQSLAQVVGGQADAPAGLQAQSTQEQVRRWQLWYQEHPELRSAGR